MKPSKIDNVVQRLKNKGAKGAVFLGAGCSSTAGIPMAQRLIEEIEEKYGDILPPDIERTYMSYMEELDPVQRQQLIIESIKDKPVNAAHLALAYLMKTGRIDLVVTTNFDFLLPRACAIVGADIAVYGIEALAELADTYIDHIGLPAVFYIHGQAQGFKQKNIESDFLEDHERNVRKLLSYISASHTLLVVGYSGENDPTAPLLWEFDYQASLYWIGYLNHEPAPKVLARLSGRKSTFLVSGHDADGFFSKLNYLLNDDSSANQIRSMEDVVRKPFSFLNETMSKLTTSDKELRDQCERRIQQAILTYESDVSGETVPVGDPHLGLVLTLSPFGARRGGDGYQTSNLLNAGAGDEDFRRKAFQTNWGPAIAALEHHELRLERIWVLCTDKITVDDFQLFASLANSTRRKNTLREFHCQRVDIANPNDVLEVEQKVRQIYDAAAPNYGWRTSDIICDITGGLSTITAGIVLAAASKGYPLQYLSQEQPLVQDGRALSQAEMREKGCLVAIRTTGIEPVAAS